MHHISAINNSPQTSPYVSSRTPTPTNISPQILNSINVLSQTSTSTNHFPSTESKLSTQRHGSKRKQSSQDDAYQTALIEALKEPSTQEIDPLDGFLVRLGEGMRKLPYRDRARLEIQFLTSLFEMENSCFNRDFDKST
ncbi:PREDICTED: uncharacterized protein LOC108759427 [Trachymyrmex cornetzi]|uniref:uncharacterized protein LOC108759427 n=1 Tax=Trachymyrmex cornetzi TaxID=471704 RepID=UPI00084F7991|nr:PREDICTED: uncharacterized protein LOC108759427 [Trachymyrmex cornetzi]